MSTEKIESWRDLLVCQRAHAEVRRVGQIHRKNKRVPKHAHFLCALCDLLWLPQIFFATKDHKERREQSWIFPLESHTALESLYTEISKMTNALLRSLKAYTLRS
jgi:hypothetical protein